MGGSHRGSVPKSGDIYRELDYFGDADVASGVDEGSVELITDGDVEVCFDGW